MVAAALARQDRVGVRKVPEVADNSTLSTDHTVIARRAIEEVCSGRKLEAVKEFYAPDFIDHVNALEYHGTEGARQSVALYLAVFPDLSFTVEDQVTEGNRVASRWTLQGTHRGRQVRLTGIVISRIENGKIVEDWAASDTLELARQLGVWRSLLLAVRRYKLLRRDS
jgi:predicted ester cyclase